MQSDHRLQLLVTILLVVLVLAGCGGTEPTATVTTTTPSVTTPPVTTPKSIHVLEGFEDCAQCHYGAGFGGAKTVPRDHCCEMCHQGYITFDHLDLNDSCTLCHKLE